MRFPPRPSNLGLAWRLVRTFARRCLRAGLAAILCTHFLTTSPFFVVQAGNASASESLTIEVREISGLRRAASPVAFKLRLPRAIAHGTAFALKDAQGSLVPAQFSPATESAGPTPNSSEEWWLDFNAELEPWQVRRYSVHYGPDVAAAPPPTAGHLLTESDAAFEVSNAPYIFWKVPRDLAGLLRSVHFPPVEHLKPDSPGLVLRDRDGQQHVLGQGFHTGRVTRNGRRAVALRFEGTAPAGKLEGVRSTVDLLFPSPVSWVEVDWTVDDPHARVAALGSVLQLALDSPRVNEPTLVDFGATSWIYAALGAEQSVEFTGGTPAAEAHRVAAPWTVVRYAAGKSTTLASGPQVLENSPPPEGWAHIMDHRRCLALSVDQFASSGRDSIAFSAEGRTAIWRGIAQDDAARPDAPPATRHRLRFWLHFVFFPPQASAATNPRMMQTPPAVSVIAP
ncbi:MAG: hypothetical protein FJ295_09635 [Planctomycetes bacterium]|nr:hypothetical protein [Planctomycetota bacterium]